MSSVLVVDIRLIMGVTTAATDADRCRGYCYVRICAGIVM